MALTSPLTAKEYFSTILKPAQAAGAEPDVFTRYALSPNEGDPQAIERHLADVHAIWQKNDEHTKYGSVIKTLLEQHDKACSVLRDPAARAMARRELQGREEQARANARAVLEQAIAVLRQGNQPLRLSWRRKLENIGLRAGMTPEEVAARLDAESFLDDIGATRPRLPAETFAMIENELAAVRATRPEVGPTLFSFLGAPFDATQQQLVQAHATVSKTYRKASYRGIELSRLEHLLTETRRLLIDGDPDLYRASVLERVKTQLTGTVELMGVALGRLVKTDRVRLADEVAREQGLDPASAETAVVELANSLGVEVEGLRPRPEPGGAQPPPEEVPDEARRQFRDLEIEIDERGARGRGSHGQNRTARRSGGLSATEALRQLLLNPVLVFFPWGPRVRAERRALGRGIIAPIWWVPTLLIPLFGAGFSWWFAWSRSRNGAYGRNLLITFACWLVIAVLGGGAAGGAAAFFIWVAQIVHVLRKRREVMQAIREGT